MPKLLAVYIVLSLSFVGSATRAGAAVIPVATAAQLISAIDGAAPGDVITLQPGTYGFSQNLLCDTAGTADAPIVVRAETLGSALLRFDMVEGFKLYRRPTGSSRTSTSRAFAPCTATASTLSTSSAMPTSPTSATAGCATSTPR